jgi:hypothetical protein
MRQPTRHPLDERNQALPHPHSRRLENKQGRRGEGRAINGGATLGHLLVPITVAAFGSGEGFSVICGRARITQLGASIGALKGSNHDRAQRHRACAG